MLVIGIDPGTIVLGYGIVDRQRDPRLVDAGVIRAKATWPIERRLARIQAELDQILGEHTIEAAGVELPFLGKGGRQTAIALGAARGIVLSSLARKGIPIQSLMANQLRRKYLGSLKATKEQVSRLVGGMLGVDTSDAPEDATDALLLALGMRLPEKKAG